MKHAVGYLAIAFAAWIPYVGGLFVTFVALPSQVAPTTLQGLKELGPENFIGTFLLIGMWSWAVGAAVATGCILWWADRPEPHIRTAIGSILLVFGVTATLTFLPIGGMDIALGNILPPDQRTDAGQWQTNILIVGGFISLVLFVVASAGQGLHRRRNRRNSTVQG